MLAARNTQGERARDLLAKSRAQLWLDTDDVAKTLARVMNTPTRVTRGGRHAKQINQAEAAKNLMASAAKDETGMATEGVRREFVQTATSCGLAQSIP